MLHTHSCVGYAVTQPRQNNHTYPGASAFPNHVAPAPASAAAAYSDAVSYGSGVGGGGGGTGGGQPPAGEAALPDGVLATALAGLTNDQMENLTKMLQSPGGCLFSGLPMSPGITSRNSKVWRRCAQAVVGDSKKWSHESQAVLEGMYARILRSDSGYRHCAGRKPSLICCQKTKHRMYPRSGTDLPKTMIMRVVQSKPRS